MSKIIANAFKGLFNIASFLIAPKLLRKTSGARFSSGREIAKVLSASNTGVLVDGKNKYLSAKDSFEHIAVIAKPGSGKTTSFIIPNLLEKASQKCSVITLDPSGELFEATSGIYEKKGFRVIVFNPANPFESVTFNPFDGLGASNLVEIEQICSSIVLSKYGSDKDPIWNDGAISLIEIFAKCLAFTCPEKLNLANVYLLLQRFGTDGADLDDWVSDHCVNPLDEQDKSINNAWLGITASNENMLMSYTTIAKTALKIMNNRDIQKLLSSDGLDLFNFRKNKTIVYLNIPAHQQEYYQIVIDILYTRLFNVLMSSRPKKNDLDVYCFLDEFGSSYINDFQSIINNIRKYRVSVSIVMQTIAQLKAKYGNSASAIKGGIGSYIVYSGADLETADEISKVIGKEKNLERNSFSDIENRVRENLLLNPDELRTLESDKLVFVSTNRQPFKLKQTPFYMNSKYKRLTSIKPARLTTNEYFDINSIEL